MNEKPKNPETNPFESVLPKTDMSLVHVPRADSGSKKTLKQKLMLVVFTVAVFIFFAIYFLPLDQIAENLLQEKLGTQNILDYKNLKLSIGGKVSFDEFTARSRQNAWKISLKYLQGKFSVLSYLFSNKLVSDMKILGIETEYESIISKNGIFDIKIEIGNFSKNMAQWQGKVSIRAEAIQLTYKAVPFVGEDINTVITVLKLEGKINGNYLELTPEKNIIESDMATIKVEGKLGIAVQNIDVSIYIVPKEKLYEKYKEAGIREVLQSMGYLQPDGRIEIKLSGITSNLKTTVVQQPSQVAPNLMTIPQ